MLTAVLSRLVPGDSEIRRACKTVGSAYDRLAPVDDG